MESNGKFTQVSQLVVLMFTEEWVDSLLEVDKKVNNFSLLYYFLMEVVRLTEW